VFGAVIDLVRAAQQAGEIKGGNAKHISALIFGTAYGRLGRLKSRSGCLGSLLLDLLASADVAVLTIDVRAEGEGWDLPPQKR